MILSKNNIISANSITLNTGAISSGALGNLQNPNFSKVLSSVSNVFKFTVASVGTCSYVALHGISLPIGSVVTVVGSNFSQSHTVAKPIKNLVFYAGIAVALNSLAIQIIGAGTKTISYMQAGLSTEIDWGTNAGQTLHYLSHNRRSRVSTNSRGMPTRSVQEEVTPRINVNNPNALKSWAKSDFKELLNHYDTTGIVSMLDYEEEQNPEESYALFDLTGGEVNTHSQTTTLVSVSMSFRVVA